MMHSPRQLFIKLLGAVSALIFLIACGAIIYDIKVGHFLFGKDFGSGAYYYTDVPQWKEIFIDSPSMGFSHPLLAIALFVGWALLMYKTLCWLDDKF